MSFCYNCGEKLVDDANFCHKCGKPIKNEILTSKNKREIVYEGDIHKCPNCGEIIDAFSPKCPSCGLELRNSKSANSLYAFSEKIALIDNRERKINLIKSFPIPNTKEDILEFMILASSNIDYQAYSDLMDNKNQEIPNAWFSKLEQANKKAHLMFSDNSELKRFNKIYKETSKKIKKAKRKQSLIIWLIFLAPFVFLIIINLYVYGIRHGMWN